MVVSQESLDIELQYKILQFGMNLWGRSADEIAVEYNLTLADVYAALAYYYDHREKIDQSIKDSDTFIELLRKKTTSKVSRKLHE